MKRKGFFFFLMLLLFFTILPHIGFTQGRGLRRGMAEVPQGTRWVPGHFEIKNGQKIWIRGGYQPIKEIEPAASAPNSASLTPSQQNNSSQPRFKNKNIAPTKPLPTPQQQDKRQWIPGHHEIVDGKEQWIRGHFADEKGTVSGPERNLHNRQAIAPNLSAKKTSPQFMPQGWAVVIGISDYKHSAGKFSGLRYAATDAKKFHDFLRTPEGGGMPPDRTLLLLNEEATLERINYAFFEFLKQALEEDYVVIYFSGHGSPEESDPENLYLVAYDTHPERLASTAFPMWDIEVAFKRHIRSERVVMYADACHSAGISSDITTRSIYKKNMVNKFLLEIARAKKGRAIFTGSEAGELSQESRKWGGGHGVFTYYLLRGLQGEADVNDNNIITLGEVIDFVSENVRRATNNKQHPDTSGIFDREFPVAIYHP